MTRLNFSGPLTREHSGKKQEKNGTGRDGTTQHPAGISRLVSNSETFPGNLIKAIPLKTILGFFGTVNLTNMVTFVALRHPVTILVTDFTNFDNLTHSQKLIVTLYCACVNTRTKHQRTMK